MAMEQPDTDSLSAVFSALSSPTRRAILARLTKGEASVLELGEPFGLTQPTISRHLKVLESAGLIEGIRDAQRRPRRLRLSAIKEVDDWIEPYRQLWERRLDNLELHLSTRKPRGEAT
jgi:DNA-binding transcriptional ArsR family regulator